MQPMACLPGGRLLRRVRWPAALRTCRPYMSRWIQPWIVGDHFRRALRGPGFPAEASTAHGGRFPGRGRAGRPAGWPGWPRMRSISPKPTMGMPRRRAARCARSGAGPNISSTATQASQKRSTRSARKSSPSFLPRCPTASRRAATLLWRTRPVTAILEYLEGKLVIHHETVMTNSPTFDQQLAIDTYWNEVGGTRFLPGTSRPADRFARISWNVRAAPKVIDTQLAIATAFSIIRGISVPLGLADPEKPNIAATIWRTVSDTLQQRYYFESAYTPSVFRVDPQKLVQNSDTSKLEFRRKADPGRRGVGKVCSSRAFRLPWPHA